MGTLGLVLKELPTKSYQEAGNMSSGRSQTYITCHESEQTNKSKEAMICGER